MSSENESHWHQLQTVDFATKSPKDMNVNVVDMDNRAGKEQMYMKFEGSRECYYPGNKLEPRN